MKHSEAFPMIRWLVMMVAFVLLMDVALSLYKVISFRAAMDNSHDLAVVVAIYMGLILIAGTTFIGSAAEVRGRRRWVGPALVGSAASAMLLAGLNFVGLSEWPAAAIENKTSTLLVSLVLLVLLAFVRSRPQAPGEH